MAAERAARRAHDYAPSFMSELEGAGHSTDRRVEVVLGVVVGACVAVFTWFVTLGRLDFFGRGTLADLFDVQARSILDGHLDAGDNAYGFESFTIDGRTYTYFGVFPSVLRMPVLALTDSYDGRLTTVSMLLAYVVALVSVAAIIIRVRRLARPDAPWTPRAVAMASTLLALVGLGSNLFILASAARVYFEAAMWGAAGVLVSFAATLGFLLDPSRRRTILFAGLGAAIAWLSRGSVGLAPSIVLGLLGLTFLLDWRVLHALAPRPDREDRDARAGAALLAAAIVPAVAFGIINTAKFGSPTALPFDRMTSSAQWEHRVEVLDRYGSDMAHPEVVPSHLLHNLRPDLVGFDRVWPFVHLEDRKPPNVNNAFFDTVEPTAGLTATAPALLVLTVVGAVPIFRRRRRADDDTAAEAPGLACLRPFVLGGLVPIGVVATVAFVAQRYLTDFVPLLVVGACAGVVTLEAASETWTPLRRRASLAPVGALVLAGVYVTLSVTWVMQRFITPPDTAALAAGLRTQESMAHLAGVRGPQVDRVSRLPEDGDPGELVVVGDCDGLYRAEAGGWKVIEAGPNRGHFAVSVTLDEAPPTRPAVLLATGSDDDYLVVGLESVDDGQVRLVSDRNGTLSEGQPFTLSTGVPHRVDVWADPEHLIVVQVDGVDRHAVFHNPAPALGDTAIARNPYGGPISRKVPGTVRAADVPLPTCQALAD